MHDADADQSHHGMNALGPCTRAQRGMIYSVGCTGLQ